MVTDAEELQRQLYNRITEELHAGVVDEFTRQYVDRFVCRPLFGGIELANLRVLDAACGAGGLTSYLVERGAVVTGLDISEATVASYKSRFPECTALARSMFDNGLPDASFDMVCMGGALHHFHPNVHRAIEETHRLLKPGGYFCFTEPHTGSVFDVLRRIWYRFDRRYFEENEEAIDPTGLARDHADKFEAISTCYVGGLGYLLILMPVFLRIPPGLKRYYAVPTIALEEALSPLQGRRTSFIATCQWRKR